jgi:RNA polymerase sigma-70 factor (ECF subfamily)
VQLAATHWKTVPDPLKELEGLFQAHHEQIFRAAYRITGSIVDAEDALQTVFLRLIQNKEDYHLSPNPIAYLLRAAINVSLDLLRRRIRAKAVSLDELDFHLIERSDTSPATTYENREMHRLIQKSLTSLGTKAAEVFILRYFEGYGNREIAQLLGMSEMVVAIVLHRARGRLRKEISKFLEEKDETHAKRA